MEKQVTVLFAGARGFLDKYPVEVLAKYEAGLYSFMEERYAQVLAELKEKQAIDDDLEKKMSDALTAYDEEFKDTIK
jgi:F-type H+-transporting ATPase subunit alpha